MAPLETAHRRAGEEIGLLHRVSMLQPLPLARGLEPVRVRAGQTVLRQRDPADRFYVIETGAADVIGDGHLVTRLGLGEGFGEIALMRRVPRTATARAATDLDLQALTCDRFLPVVTGFPPSSREAGAEVEEMLDRSARKDRLTTKASRGDIDGKSV